MKYRIALFTMTFAAACGGEDQGIEFKPFAAPYCQDQRDDLNDGTVDSLENPYYEDGLLVSIDIVFGARSDIERFSYDANGNLVRKEYDTSIDGSIDRLELFTFDENGNEISYRLEGAERDTVIVRNRYYNAAGLLESTEFDFDADGSPERVITHTSDSDGHIVRDDVVVRTPGGSTGHSLYTYQDDLLVLEEHFDVPATFGSTIRHTYDERGFPLTTEIGTGDRELKLFEYAWDSRGRMTYSIDRVSVTVATTRNYDCLD